MVVASYHDDHNRLSREIARVDCHLFRCFYCRLIAALYCLMHGENGTRAQGNSKYVVSEAETNPPFLRLSTQCKTVVKNNMIETKRLGERKAAIQSAKKSASQDKQTNKSESAVKLKV
jgi:hypothetical protein